MNSALLLNRRNLLRAAVASPLCTLLHRQLTAADPTFTADVNVVNVFVTVRDKKGTIITDLSKEDFVLSEEGREQPIRYFARQSDLPLTLGLLVDATPSETNMLTAERNATSLFFAQVLHPEKDNAFLVQYDDEVELLQDVTSSREKLEKSLDLLGGEDQARLRKVNQAGPRAGRNSGGGADSTVLSDAIFLGADEILKPRKGRKAMIVLGDGDHMGDRKSQATAAAQQADCLVYTIRIYDKDFGGGGPRRLGNWHGLDIPGIGGPGLGGGPGAGGPGGGGPGGGGPRSDGKRNLQQIAAKTGGSYFEVNRKESLEQIYRKIEEELRNQYSLGFVASPNSGGAYRRIKVSTKQKNLLVQARDGFYPRTGAL